MIEKFTKDLVSEIKVKRLRKTIYDEIVDHLYLSKEDYIKPGLSEEEAEMNALKDFGNKEEVVEYFNEVYQKQKFIDFLLKLSIVIMVLYILISYTKAYQKRHDPNYFFNGLNIVERRVINEKIKQNHYIYKYKEVVLLKDGRIYLYYTKHKVNPLNRYVTENNIINNNITSLVHVPDFDDYEIAGNIFRPIYINTEGVLEIEESQIPEVLEITFDDHQAYKIDLKGK